MVEYADEHPGLEEQSVPANTHCPNCGDPPTPESVVQHQLSAMGYLHDDVKFECSECDESWLHGIPIGEGGHGDLWCEACDRQFMVTHRVEHMMDEGELAFRLHVKCPNCYHFEKLPREPDENNTALVGDPRLTGTQDGQTLPDGYEDGTLNTDD